MTYYPGKRGHGGSGSSIAQAKSGAKLKNWGKFYSLIEAMQIGFEEPGTRGKFQMEGIFTTLPEAQHEIRELERFRRDFQKLKLDRAVLDRRFEVEAAIKVYHRNLPQSRNYWIQLSFTHLPKEVNSQLADTWKIIRAE